MGIVLLIVKGYRYACFCSLSSSPCWPSLSLSLALPALASLDRPAVTRPTAPPAAPPPELAAAPTTSTAVFRTRERPLSVSALDLAPDRDALALDALCLEDSAPTTKVFLNYYY